MRRRLSYMNNEHGFSLPYILFIIILSFIFITANINIYQNEVYMMNHLTEQIKVETLIQMSLSNFEDDILNYDDLSIIEDEKSYSFPSGDVNLKILSTEKKYVWLRLYISTDEQTSFTIKSRIIL